MSVADELIALRSTTTALQFLRTSVHGSQARLAARPAGLEGAGPRRVRTGVTGAFPMGCGLRPLLAHTRAAGSSRPLRFSSPPSAQRVPG